MWIDPENIKIAQRHMNVEIGAEAALFREKEYISGIFVAVHAYRDKIPPTSNYCISVFGISFSKLLSSMGMPQMQNYNVCENIHLFIPDLSLMNVFSFNTQYLYFIRIIYLSFTYLHKHSLPDRLSFSSVTPPTITDCSQYLSKFIQGR
jgi:hypothetical protein